MVEALLERGGVYSEAAAHNVSTENQPWSQEHGPAKNSRSRFQDFARELTVEFDVMLVGFRSTFYVGADQVKKIWKKGLSRQKKQTQ
jgi:hypothetical protein